MRLNKIITTLILFLGILNKTIYSQNVVKTFKEPILTMDFGSAEKDVKNNVGSLPRYRKTNSNCPNDGEYSFTPYTKGCFGDRWIFVSEDHTAGDKSGKMMLINASERPATFFIYAVKNVTPNSHYEFSVWITNVCRTASECVPNPPNITFTIQDMDGKQLAKFRTGFVSQTGYVNWKRYSGEFLVPMGVNSIVIKLDDETNGGCGNDFAIDDLMLREFILEQPKKETPEVPKPIVVNEKRKPVKEVRKEDVPSELTFKKDVVDAKPIIEKKEEQVPVREVEKTKEITLVTKPTVVPKVLIERSNQIAKKVQMEAGEILIELYDNGEVDGDTVTVFDNNNLLTANAGLSTKPIRLTIKIDKDHPHHEIVMVANNLGSIPPNTSMMVITSKNVRHEIFISSSEERNAKVVIDLKE